MWFSCESNWVKRTPTSLMEKDFNTGINKDCNLGLKRRNNKKQDGRGQFLTTTADSLSKMSTTRLLTSLQVFVSIKFNRLEKNVFYCRAEMNNQVNCD